MPSVVHLFAGLIKWVRQSSAVRSFARLPRFQKIATAVILAILVAGGLYFFGRKSVSVEATTEQTTHTVEVRSVAQLSAESIPFSTVGIVSSKSEATVLAQKSGEIIAINHTLGDFIESGTVVAQMENASERAAVQQAQGAVDAATAALAKVKGGTRSEQLDILKANLASSKSSAVNALLSAYAAVDGAVKGTADPLFSNPSGAQPHFNIPTSNTQARTSAENIRSTFGPTLDREAQVTSSIAATSDLGAELSRTETEIRSARAFFDTILSALGSAIITTEFPASVIAADVASASGARSSLTAALSGISAARAALEVAQKSLDQGVTGAQQEDVDSIAAALTQAKGAYAATLANLEKTIIRAPISGTINSFNQKRGDFVQMFSPVLTVANNGTLEIVAHVTEDDAAAITVGQSVSIEGGLTGTVTRAASALDPLTKKLEVRIDVKNGKEKLVNGQSVIVNFARGGATTIDPRHISIPISAVKVGSDSMSVFTIGTSSELVAHAVTVGLLQGDRVVISAGLTPDLSIVTDARGLRAGEIVTVK